MLYISNKYTVMSLKPKKSALRSISPKDSIERAKSTKKQFVEYSIQVRTDRYSWGTKMEKVAVIRKGLPYESIEVISRRTDTSMKQFLAILGLPQTTYNKKKREKDLLNSRDSEVVVFLTELLDFGLSVFNNENDKFQRWLKKPNGSLGGVTPESLFDSLTGIQEVRNSLNRLEYGNMA